MPAKTTVFTPQEAFAAPVQVISYSKKQYTEGSSLVGNVEWNRNPYQWSSRFGALLVVTNFFFIVFLVMMIIIATLVLELNYDNISVAQRQAFILPAYERAIEVSNIVCAGLLIFVMCIGISSNLSDCISPKKQLVLSWINFITVCALAPAQMALTTLYFLMLNDNWMTIFFLTIFGIFVGFGLLVALVRVVAITAEYRAQNKVEKKQTEYAAMSQA